VSFLSPRRKALRVTVNGESKEIPNGATLSDLLVHIGLKPELVAVEVNRVIIRKHDWSMTTLTDGDSLEIVHFVGGGC
jgi:thiamine biosynthesis protein ThiS